MKRLLALATFYGMGTACHLLHDIGGCGLLNGTWYIGYDEATDTFRHKFETPWSRRLWAWAMRETE